MEKISTRIITLFMLFVLAYVNMKIEPFILVMLISIIAFCICLLLNNQKYINITIVLFALLACFIHPFALVIPAFVYVMDTNNYVKYGIIIYIPVILSFNIYNNITILVVTFSMLISIMNNYKDNKDSRRLKSYIKQRDDLMQASQNLEEKIGELNSNQDTQIQVAILNERNRIAREIHDNIGHLLSSAILQIGAVMTITKEDKTISLLKTIQNTLDTGMNSIRESVHNLYDESFDLKAKLFEITNDFLFCELGFEYDINFQPGIEIKYSVICIIKEALSNVARHSDATKVNISFKEYPSFYQLKIEDNGHSSSIKHSDGIGLKSIKQRVQVLQGICNITNEKGFKIFISVPKEIK